jgi:glycosyltransferase involved in cell wall biosynthesis
MDQCDVMLAPYQRVVLVADGRTDAAPWMSPLKIFEYMAAGKPMLASDLPVIREILANGDTALLLPPDQPALWAEALCRLRDDRDLRHRLGQSAHRTFLKRHTWIQRARAILDACREHHAPDPHGAAEPLRSGRAV